MKSAGADRLDLGAQAVERVAMDARQQPPVAPFEVVADLIRTAAVRSARAGRRLRIRAPAAPRRRRRRRCPATRRAPPPSSARRSPGARAAARRSPPRASTRAPRATAAPRSAVRAARRDGSASNSGSRSAAIQMPIRGPGSRSPADARVPQRSSERRRRARDFVVEQKPGGQQRVVQFVGVARIGTLFVAHALDRRRRRARRMSLPAGRSPRASAPPASAAPRAAHRPGTRTAAR